MREESVSLALRGWCGLFSRAVHKAEAGNFVPLLIVAKLMQACQELLSLKWHLK